MTECFEVQLLTDYISERGTYHVEKCIELLLLHLSGTRTQQKVSDSELNGLAHSYILHRRDYSVHELVHP